MGLDTVFKVVKVHQLKGGESRTEEMKIHGYVEKVDSQAPLYFYGSDNTGVESLFEKNSKWNEPIHENYSYLKTQVIWAVLHEMARTVEDFLARRVRVLFLDARAAIEMAETVAD